MWKKVALGTVAGYLGYRALTPNKITLPPPPKDRKRCIFITGAASGFGAETVKLFLQKGWFVGAYDVNAEALQKMYGEMRKEDICFSFLDVTDSTSCDDALSHFLERSKGKLDVLFNCAGLLVHGKFDQTPLEKLLGLVRVNIDGVVQLTSKALPALKDTKDSRVITMASLAAIGGIPMEAVYGATKCFVYSWTESMRTEMYPCVRFADISVGMVNTPMIQSQNQENYTKEAKRTMNDVKPSDVAEVVWKAVNECDFDKEHFYVACSWAFSFNYFSRFIGSQLHAKLLKHMLLKEE